MKLSLERLRRQAWVRGADERADRRASALDTGFDPAPSCTAEEDLDLSMVRELGPASGLDLDEVL